MDKLFVSCPEESSGRFYRGESVVDRSASGVPVKWEMDIPAFLSEHKVPEVVAEQLSHSDALRILDAVMMLIAKDDNRVVFINEDIFEAILDGMTLNLIFLDFEAIRARLSPWMLSSDDWFTGDGFYRVTEDGPVLMMSATGTSLKDGELTYSIR